MTLRLEIRSTDGEWDEFRLPAGTPYEELQRLVREHADEEGVTRCWYRVNGDDRLYEAEDSR